MQARFAGRRWPSLWTDLIPCVVPETMFAMKTRHSVELPLDGSVSIVR